MGWDFWWYLLYCHTHGHPPHDCLTICLSGIICCRVQKMAPSGYGACRHLPVWLRIRDTITQFGTLSSLHTDTILCLEDMTEWHGKRILQSYLLFFFFFVDTISLGHIWSSSSIPDIKWSYHSLRRLWATDHHQPLRIFAGHLSDVTCTRFHPNSNYVATGSADRTVRLWDVLNGNCVRILTGHKVGFQEGFLL